LSAHQTGLYEIDFESLISTLAQNLYTNPKVVIRELVQNASDSCSRRMSIEPYSSRIAITVDRPNHQLIVQDNGAGMIHQEVVYYLASIGRGKTREERRRFLDSGDAAAQEAARMLIGQFGIGFLSSFIVADEVVVDTYSPERGKPVNWICHGTQEYEIGEGTYYQQGTRVCLNLRPQHYDLLDEDTVRGSIIRYADLIAHPIFLNAEQRPVNRMNAPWHIEASEAEYADYIKHRYGAHPLALLPIQEDEGDKLRVQGVIFIPPGTTAFHRRLGSVDLFQTRMYVTEDLDLLPDWAAFACAVLDCPTLDLVASREAVIRARPSYLALQRFLADTITRFVTDLARFQRPTFLEIIRQHEWAVMIGALRNDTFFHQVKDLIPFGSDAGRMVLPAYLERAPARLGGMRTIVYMPGDHPVSSHQSSLFKAQGIPILQADVVEEQFLRKYVAQADNLNLRPLHSGIIDVLEADRESRWQGIVAWYQELGIVASAVKFAPTEMMAVAVRQDDFDQKRLVSQLINGERMLSDFMRRIGREKSDAYGLAFNTENPTIQKLISFDGAPKVRNIVLRSIYASALLAAGVELTNELSQEIANTQQQVLSLLMEQVPRTKES
jgi:molecular chaperone HtpG